MLCRILDAPDRDRVAVFRRTKRGVDRTIKGLVEEGYKAGALHGDMPQVTREKVMRAFRKGKLDVLVCTDVASRGLDIAGLSHVINYDTPEDDRAYVHRIGRTGRAGAAGVAVTFVAWNELDTADLIRRRLELTDEPARGLLDQPAAGASCSTCRRWRSGGRPGRGRRPQGRDGRAGVRRGAGPPALPVGRPPAPSPPHAGRRAAVGGHRLGESAGAGAGSPGQGGGSAPAIVSEVSRGPFEAATVPHMNALYDAALRLAAIRPPPRT